MKDAFKTVPCICSFALLTASIAGPAAAEAAVRVDFGTVTVGYRDGYQNNHHQWHHWHHRSDVVAYRSNHQQNYRDMNFRDDHRAPDSATAGAMIRQQSCEE